MSRTNRPAPHPGIMAVLMQHIQPLWSQARVDSDDEHKLEHFVYLANSAMFGTVPTPIDVFRAESRTYIPPAPVLDLLLPWLVQGGRYLQTWEDADKAYKAYQVAQALKGKS